MMIHYLVFLAIVLTLFCVSSAQMKTGARNKRILYGHEAKDKNRDAYQSFRYYVYLAKAPMGEIEEDPSKISSFKKWLRKFNNPSGAILEYMDCGGSLLTPNIVQTACHCLALYTKRSNDDNFTYAYPLNVWEDRIYSYIGSNEASKMRKMLIPKHYIVYEQCRAIMFHLQFNVMDYGFIITKDSVDQKAPKAEISYAPTYGAKDILEFYYTAIQKEFMCLVIGHGDWEVPHLVNFKPFILEGASEPQRWGWRTVMNYVDCLSASYPPQDRELNSLTGISFNYTGDASWVCFQAFKKWKKWNFVFGPGDSGGPVACTGVFFAIASMAVDYLSMAAPIAHTSFENAADYRDQFVKWTRENFLTPDHTEDMGPDFPYTQDTYPDLIPTPPPDVHPASQCSLLTIQPHLVLSSTLFFGFL